MSATHPERATGFDLFGFDPAVVRGIRASGFDTPRPIQRDAIPAVLEGRDVLGLAQTGTGKTAAFALPLIHRLIGGKRALPRVLVLAPTRELVTQIDAEIRSLARFTKIHAVTVFGGVSLHGQINAIQRRPEIIVGCPGRVLDLVDRRALRLGEVQTVVLDEADHMFDMGFLPSLRRILSALPARRQNLLFSATMPREIRALADEVLDRPHVIELSHQGPAPTIDHALVSIREDRKRDLLKHILEADGCRQAIVFTRTKHRAKRLAQQLDHAGHRAIGLQGNMSQGQRDRAMQGFRKRRFDVLVATDIAARGIDVQGVSHVINFDVPNTPEAYTHRIGRTGRAELDGQALTFVTRDDVGWLRDTERQLGAAITRRTVDGFEGESLECSGGGRQRNGGSGNNGGRAGKPPHARGRRRGSRNRYRKPRTAR
jgi:ATP-dependent RNA helicase RhlE